MILTIPTRNAGGYGSNDNATPTNSANFFVGVTNNSYGTTLSGANGTTSTKYYVIKKTLFSHTGPTFSNADGAMNISSGSWNTSATDDGNMTYNHLGGVGGTGAKLINNVNGTVDLQIKYAKQNGSDSNYFDIEFDNEVICTTDGQHWGPDTYKWSCN